MTRRWLTVLGGLAALLVVPLAAACGGGDNYADSIPAATTRAVQITAFEVKGGTTASELTPPSVDPSTLSDGYGWYPLGFDEGNPDKWQVASYMWTPGTVTAFQGDTLNLNFFVLNGNEHDVWIEGPDGETVLEETEMNRGREYQITLRVTKPGVYRLICNTHEPTMTAEIVVLPRPSS